MSFIRIRIIILLFLNLISFLLFSQLDYNAYYRQMRPVLDCLSTEEKIDVLHNFLLKAEQIEDTVKIIHGNMYLANEYFLQADFPQAMKYLHNAEDFAQKQNHELLLGRINHKKGAVFMVLTNYTDAIDQFEKSLDFSSAVKDSQYIAITLEQLGAVYGYQDQYEQSNEYYATAIPLVKKYCDKKALAATLSNYGNILCSQDSTQAAVECYKQALAINEEIGEEYQAAISKQNLAIEYLHFNKLNTALKLLRECEQSNKKNGWQESLIYVYMGLSSVYEKMNKPDSALYYFKAYHSSQDSIIGTEVQNQISHLETEITLKKKEIALLKQKEAVEKQRQKTKNFLIGALLLLSLCGTGIWLLLQQRKRNQLRLKEHRESLIQLAQMLQVKNSELRDYQKRLLDNHQKPANENDILAVDPYEMRILTLEDWLSFKSLFEKSYPRFLQKLRMDYPQISEAEERLFLLIKLNLNNREIADILGIQVESVKKNRTRLRKRLKLNREASLERFVLGYGLKRVLVPSSRVDTKTA